MCLQKETMKYTKDYLVKINKIKELITNADKVVVGIGAGLSAAGGLNYMDENLAKKWYPQYYNMGLRSIVEIQSVFWNLSDCKAEKYWNFWAEHIWHIRYEAEALEPYTNLYKLLKGKDYFICTTNVDSQCEKAGFSKNKVFAMQGNYAYFQCSAPCSNELYYNEEIIKTIIENRKSSLEIDIKDVPKCPKCGQPLIPNLRCDDHFVEKPHMELLKDYEKFLASCGEKNTVFLELGVGFNTPGIIRYPFERFTYMNSKATLIRINIGDISVSDSIKEHVVTLDKDLNVALRDIAFL